MKKLLILFCLLPITAFALADWQQTEAEQEHYKIRQTAEKKTFKQVKGEVKAGFADSLIDLADLYYEGIGTKKSYKKAYRYYRKAARQGNSYAAYSQAFMLMYGQGVKPNPPKAFAMFSELAENGFALTADDVRAAWSEGCKAIILNFPTNPTGGVMPRSELEKLAKFAQEKNMLVISDEIYSELTYEGEHVSIAAIDGMRERTVFLHGFSKAFAMTGFRIGYACAPRPIIEGMMKTHQYAVMCAPIISQIAGIEALVNGTPDMERMRDQYRRRRDFIVKRFNAMGMPCLMPKGTFYAFPNISGFGLSSMDFAKKILSEAKVALVPGSAFGESGEGFVRAAFSTSYDNLIEAADRMERVLKKM